MIIMIVAHTQNQGFDVMQINVARSREKKTKERTKEKREEGMLRERW